MGAIRLPDRPGELSAKKPEVGRELRSSQGLGFQERSVCLPRGLAGADGLCQEPALSLSRQHWGFGSLVCKWRWRGSKAAGVRMELGERHEEELKEEEEKGEEEEAFIVFSPNNLPHTC